MKNEITNLLEQEIENLNEGNFRFDFEADLKFRSPNRRESKYHTRKMGHKTPELTPE